MFIFPLAYKIPLWQFLIFYHKGLLFYIVRFYRTCSCGLRLFYFPVWQESLIGQSAHPHEQEDFPFFLFFIICMIIAATTKIKTAQIIIVAMFSVNQAIIFLSPVHNDLFYRLNAFGKLCSF